MTISLLTGKKETVLQEFRIFNTLDFYRTVSFFFFTHR